jgi:hypothetical protein
VPLSTTIEPDGIFGTTLFFSTGCFLKRLDFKRGAGGGATSSVSSVVAGPLPLEALVKRVKLISICTTIAFANKGERCPVFVKGLTRFKCVLNSTVNRLVPLIGLLGYCNRLSPVGVSELCIM